MEYLPDFNRRQFMKIGALGGGLAITASALALPATAATGLGASATVTDLGPAVVVFSLAAGVPVGDTIYIASRNIDPMIIIGYHMPTRKVVSVTEAPGIATQTLTADSEGRYLYGCVRTKELAPGQPNLFRLDLSKTGAPLEPLQRIDGLDPLAMTLSPDGKIIVTGGEPQPKVYLYDPVANTVETVATPDPDAVWGRCIVASETTIYVGMRGRVPGGSATQAGLWAIDRATGGCTSIIPTEMMASAEVRDLALLDGQLLAVGSTASGGALAFIELDDPSTYQIKQAGMGVGKLPKVKGQKIYTAAPDGVVEYDRGLGTFRKVELDGIAYGEIWGLFFRGETLVVVSAFGVVLEIDPATSAAVAHDMVEAGAPPGPQMAMSISTGDGYVYVGGTNAISRHDLRSGGRVNLFAPGEAKDTIIVDGTLYSGQYSGVGVMEYTPGVDGQWPRVAAALPQNRPHELLWDAGVGRIFIGMESDTAGVGALAAFNPATREVVSTIDPFGDGQGVRALASHDGILYLGGKLGQSASSVMAWDPQARRPLWRVDPQQQPTGITGLAIQGNNLYASAYGGDFFVIECRSGKVVHAANHAALNPDWTTLLTRDNDVYGVSSQALYRFDRNTFALTPLVSGLNAEWYGMPRAAVDRQGRMYTVKGRNLISVETPSFPHATVDVQTRPVGRNMMLQVRVVNAESVPADIRIATDHGEKLFRNVQPGKSAFQSFTVRRQDIPAGSVTVTSTVVVDGALLSSERAVDYPAA